MSKTRQTINEIAMQLMGRNYYSTVAYGFITEAIEQAVKEHGTFKDIDELDKYIRENLI